MADAGLHIYRATGQPATRFVDDVSGKRFVVRNPPRRLFSARCCNTRRWAKYLYVQVYYDSLMMWCRYPHGCHREHLKITDNRRRGANCRACSRERARRWCAVQRRRMR